MKKSLKLTLEKIQIAKLKNPIYIKGGGDVEKTGGCEITGGDSDDQ